VILNRMLGPGAVDTGELDHLTYLLQSGSDRIGALDFQASPDEYVPRGNDAVPLELLARAAELIQAGEPVPAELEAAVTAGTSVGGARPKALLRDGDRRLIAKFSSQTDTYPIVRGEFLAMQMADLCGLDVAPVELTSANGKDVLLVERFDRVPGTAQRRARVSALTMLELPEFAPREASYAKLAQVIREQFTDPQRALQELFARIVFNVLSGNTDDHARNHSAFWDGQLRGFTPAYDICPLVRGGGEAVQAMIIGPPDKPVRLSQVAHCVEHATAYGLTRAEAREVVDRQLATIDDHWDDVCDQAGLAAADRAMFRRVFPAPYALEGYERAAG
jgi:serine/threonine-protein kinase HipA